MLKTNTLRVIGLCVAVAATLWNSSVANAGPCACDANINGDAIVNVIDAATVEACIEGDCSGCTASCDVNCDGVIDYVDMGAVFCEVTGLTDCCNQPSGACTGTDNNIPLDCITTLEGLCSLFAGTYHGDGSFCGRFDGGIPAASQWGLVGLTLTLLVGGTLVLARKKKTAPPSQP